jgi:Sulfotransferase family
MLEQLASALMSHGSTGKGDPGVTTTTERAVVLGAPRSGTSFLMGFLDALPEVESVSGNLLPIGIAHLAAQELPGDVLDVLQRSFRGALAEYLTTSIYHSRWAAMRKWWTASRRPSDLRLASKGIRTERVLAYKEPFLAFAPEFAYEALPTGRLIYIFRDGRDVADSLIRTYDILTDEKLADLETNEVPIGKRTGDRYTPWWVADGEEHAFLAATPYTRAVWMWREMIRRCRQFLDRPDVVASGRVLQVRYEDLMRDPLRQGEAILGHLDTPMTPKARKLLQAAHARSIGIHTRLEESEISEAERLAGTELEDLGYTLRNTVSTTAASPAEPVAQPGLSAN